MKLCLNSSEYLAGKSNFVNVNPGLPIDCFREWYHNLWVNFKQSGLL
uniref:Uncharacterized protein n=1 Tax=Rhizophora mucronata TaxID=61149 RepID=A0A2P2QYE3_RHIMU